MVNKEPFGGMTVSFDGVKDTTIGEIMGKGKFPITHMMKKIWAFVKTNELTSKKPVAAWKNLENYYGDIEYEDLELKQILKYFNAIGVKDKVGEKLKTVFKLQKKGGEKFETAVDAIVEKVIEEASKKEKKAKAKK